MQKTTEKAKVNLTKESGKGQIPEFSKCMELLKNSPFTDKNIIRHCVKVAETAVKICSFMDQSPPLVNVDLVRAGALVHDIARMHPDHAAKGAFILKDMGFSDIADIVADHMNLKTFPDSPLNEKEIVYFADKLTVKDRLVLDAEKRFKEKISLYKDNPQAVQAINARLETFSIIREKLSSILHKDIILLLNDKKTE